MAASSRYIAIVTGLSFLCFVLCCVAVFLPYWGFFEDSNTSFGSDHGYFSPWKVCKELAYDRTKCGSAENGSRFRPSHFVLASGITIAVSTVVLALHFLLSVKQIYAVSSRDEDVAGYNSLVTQKLVLAVFGALTTFASGGMFLIQSDDIKRGFEVTRGISFYLVVVAVILTIILGVMSHYDYTISRPSGNQRSRGRVHHKVSDV